MGGLAAIESATFYTIGGMTGPDVTGQIKYCKTRVYLVNNVCSERFKGLHWSTHCRVIFFVRW